MGKAAGEWGQEGGGKDRGQDWSFARISGFLCSFSSGGGFGGVVEFEKMGRMGKGKKTASAANVREELPMRSGRADRGCGTLLLLVRCVGATRCVWSSVRRSVCVHVLPTRYLPSARACTMQNP